VSARSLHGWGRYPVVEAQVAFPASSAAVRAALAGEKPLIPRGLGRSYGDSSLAPRAISSRYLNLLLEHDPAAGTVRCGAGVSLADLLRVFVAKGWFLPVTPGTKFVSVGGAIAADVHGKNHHRQGCFSACVERMSVATGSGELLECSRTQHADLFHATCGGMGLTGFIVEATLRLAPLAGTRVAETTHKCANLQAALSAFEECAAATYSVAWIDCMAGGEGLGRSLLTVGEHLATGALDAAPRDPLPVPFDFPGFVLNRYSIGAFNALYYQRARAGRTSREVDYDAFFYPLDRLGDWNRMYGKSGFTQYQCVIPKPAGAAALPRILARVAASGRGSFLAGYTLALDFRLDAATLRLLDELDALVLDHGGRVYLAKDCRLGSAAFRRGYPRWPEFEAVRGRYGAHGVFRSRQAERIGLA
jgi:decaprenylphospho-beta-D-ribofuranose 2-oxidase